MAKKKINIILIVLVLALWGTIGYKTINQFFSKDAVNDKKVVSTSLNLNQINKDTFQMQNIERDPFSNVQLTSPIVKKTYKLQPRKIKTVVAEKPIVVNNWPSISYHGYIKSKNKADELVLIMMDKKLYKLRKNDDINGITLYKIYKDSVELILNKQKKIIRRNHI